mgnify:FL=1
MVKVAHVQCIVRLEGVGVHHTVRLDLFLDDRQKGLGFGVGDDGRVDLSTPFQKAKNGYFVSGTSASFAFADTAKVALICLNLSLKLIAGQLGRDEFTKPLKEHSNGVPIDSGDLCRGSCCSTCNKHFYQLPSQLSA